MKSRILSSLTALCLLAALLPAGALAADTAELYVNGIDILADEDHSVVCGSGSAVYTPATATLTLMDAVIDTSISTDWPSGIEVKNLDELHIVLSGTSLIGGQENLLTGIKTSGKIYLSGEGRLEITTVNKAGTAPSGQIWYSGTGIFAPNGVDMEDVEVVMSQRGEGDNVGSGIDCNNSNFTGISPITLNRADLSISGYRCGIDSTINDITITDSTILLEDVVQGIRGDPSSSPNKKPLLISDSTVTVSLRQDVPQQYPLPPSCITGKQIVLDHASITARIGPSLPNGNAIYSSTDISVKNQSTLDVSSGWPAIYGTAGVSIESSTVNAESTADIAIYSKDGVVSVKDAWVETSSPAGSFQMDNSAVFDGKTGIVTGAFVLTGNADIQSGKTLTVPDGAILRVTAGCVLSVFGELAAEGGEIIVEEDGEVVVKEGGTATGVPDDSLTRYYTLTCDPANGSPADSRVIKGGETVTLPGAPARNGYTFAGWSDGTKTYEAATIFTVTIDTVFTAQWIQNSSGDSSPSSNTTTKTEMNQDGSTTRTVTNKKTGDVTATTTYSDGTKIVANTPKDGATSIEVTMPKDMDSVTITIPAPDQPKTGEVAVIIREDGTREIVKTSVSTEGGMRVTLSGSCKLEIVDNSKVFTDVSNGHLIDEAVAFVTSRELFNGTGRDHFSPGMEMSRAMVFTVLARLDGQNITGGTIWFDKALKWSKETGISDGALPDASITREQLVLMLYRYAGSPSAENSGMDTFTDADSVSAWAVNAMHWAVDRGIITDSDHKLSPSDTATRAEVAAMLMRFIIKMA